MKFDAVIVGAGFAGAVIAECLATEQNKKVAIIDKAPHIGGHCYDMYDENGILIHKYGPHIFHTNYKPVWDYLNSFTDFSVYHHRVLGVIEGKKVPIPFNLDTLHTLFPTRTAQRIEDKLVEEFGFDKKVPILKLRQTTDKDLTDLAEYVYNNIFKFYTKKQWGLSPEDLSPEVTGRVPVYISHDDRYFQDTYQGLPTRGYTHIFGNMLSHPNITQILNTDYKDIIKSLSYDLFVYTGPIDYFFDYSYGPLKYRTLDFESIHYSTEWAQEVGTVNYPNNYNFTRITEYKHLTGQKADTTAVMREYPRNCETDVDEPYYPMFTEEWKTLYEKYKSEANKQKNTIFLGRLAEYKYYNMDAVIHAALKIYNTLK